MSALLDLLYPPACLHCKTPLPKHMPLCTECLEYLTLLPPEGHCIKCFTEISTLTGTCKACRKISHPLKKFGVCFDAYGPGKTLLKTFYSQQRFHFAKDIAAYMILQCERLQFPSFQILSTIPHYFRNPQNRIAMEMAKILGIPFQPLLKRHLAASPRFTLKKKCNIMNQIVLLLDLAAAPLETVHSAAWALDRGLPENIYGIAFCRF